MNAQTTAIVFLSVYLSVVLLVGIYAGRKAKTGESWKFGAGGLSVFGVVAMILGTRLGATTTVGLVENVYNIGIVAFSFIFGQIVGSLIQGFTTGKLFYRTKMMTLPAFTLHRLGKRPVAVDLTLNMVIGIAINGIQVLGVGLIIEAITGIDLVWGVVIGSLLGWAYLTFGGLAATAATNLTHLVVCFLGILFGFFILLSKMPLGEAIAAMPADHSDPFTPFMTVVSWMIVGVAISIISNVYNSPLAVARSEKKAIGACVAIAFIYGIFGILVTIFGVYAITYYGPLYQQATGSALPGANAFGAIAAMMGNPDLGGSTFGLLVGTMMMAGVVGAIISTMAPLAWNISMLITHDVYLRYIRVDASSQEELLAARVMSTIYWLVPGFIALLVSQDLLGALLFLLELPVGGVFAGFLVFYWDRVNEPAAFWTSVASVTTGVAYKLITMAQPEFFANMGPWFGSSIGWIVTVSALVFFPLVFLAPPPRPEQVEIVRRARNNEEPIKDSRHAPKPAEPAQEMA